MKTIYLGNLPFSASEDDVQELFGQHGEVAKVSLITDRETGRPRGFGFVEMEPEAAAKAIDALDGVRIRGPHPAGERGPRPGGQAAPALLVTHSADACDRGRGRPSGRSIFCPELSLPS